MTLSTITGLECTRCGASSESDPTNLGCPKCRAEGTPAAFSTVYDVDAARGSFRSDVLETRPFGPSRYAELMPRGVGRFGLAEGATPLLRAEELARRLGVRSIFIKDESRNPTWSFKDRAAAIAAARALEQDCPGLVVSSTGNAAAATSAYAAAANLPAVVLFARGVDEIMAGFVRSLGGDIVATETKSDRWMFMRRCVEDFGLYPNSNFADPPVGNDPYALDGYKAIAFELWDQLGRRAPTGVVTSVGYGDSLFAIHKAFRELEAMGLAGAPRLIAGERYGSLSRTIERGGDELVKAEIDGPTVGSSIATAQSTYQALLAIRDSRGTVYQVTDEDILRAQRTLVETEGILVEAASAAGIAALVIDGDKGTLNREGDYVFINTSAGIKSIAAMGNMGIEPEMVTNERSFDEFMSRVLTSAEEGGAS